MFLFSCKFSAFFCQFVLAISVPVFASSAQDFEKSPTAENAFSFLHQIATHPRCANCHGVVIGDKHIPTVGEKRELHPMGVTSALNPKLVIEAGGAKMIAGNLGTDCLTCHRQSNHSSYGGPPGAANDLVPGFLWHMPPKKMAVPVGISTDELCRKWTNSRTNSSEAVPDRGDPSDIKKFREAFLDHHAKTDPLVIWAWNPGKGRAPVPGSHDLFVKAMAKWIDNGALCPGDRN